MNNKLIGNKNNIVFYTDEDGNTNIEVILQDEDVWLNAQAIAELFEITDKVVYKHIKKIYNQEELDEDSTVAKIATMGKNGQTYQVKYYNLDMIISIGYRVNSKKAVKFRQWANKIIKEYMVKGFALDDDRFLKGGKYNRVNAEKENMGLTTWKEAPGGMIYKYDVSIAKNYLNEEELKRLNNLTNFFLDYAESMAEENQVMTMKDWIDEMDKMYQRYLKENKKL